MDVAAYLRRFAVIGSALAVLYFAEQVKVFGYPGLAISLGEVLASFAVIVGLRRRVPTGWTGSRRTRALLAALFAAAAAGDAAWAVFNFYLHVPATTPTSVLFTRLPYNAVFILGIVVLFSALEGRVSALFSPTMAIALVLIGPVALRFLVEPFLANVRTESWTLVASQVIDIGALIALAVISLTLLVESADPRWAMYAAASLVLALGDWSTQVADRAGSQPSYDLYEFFWAGGVFLLASAALATNLLDQPLRLLTAAEAPLRHARLTVLAVGFISIFLLCLSPVGTHVATIRLVSIGAALSAIASVLASWPTTSGRPGTAAPSTDSGAPVSPQPATVPVETPAPSAPRPATTPRASTARRVEIVLLIHGIRTQAEWQERVKRVLGEIDGTVVVPVKYGFFDAVRFWWPYGTRRKILDRVERQLRDAKQVYRNGRISVVAHSFGTYAIGMLLDDKPDLTLHRLVLCGSVLPQDFRWDKIGNQVETRVVNDCALFDIWPVLAKSASWGYGLSGTYGFGGPRVVDRFHAFGHSGFFKPEFPPTFWRPWFEQDELVNGAEPVRRPYWWSLLTLVPLKWAIVGGMVFATWRLLAVFNIN